CWALGVAAPPDQHGADPFDGQARRAGRVAPACCRGKGGPASATLARQRPAALAMSDCGVTLGRHLPGHALLLSSWEDVILAIFAPRSGKTSAVAIPAVLNAPGAVVATSNKADLYLATARLREQDTGEASGRCCGSSGSAAT